MPATQPETTSLRDHGVRGEVGVGDAQDGVLDAEAGEGEADPHAQQRPADDVTAGHDQGAEGAVQERQEDVGDEELAVHLERGIRPSRR